jgi:hypothetical protein
MNSLARINRQPELVNGSSGKRDEPNGTPKDRRAPQTEKSSMSYLRSENASEAAITEQKGMIIPL